MALGTTQNPKYESFENFNDSAESSSQRTHIWVDTNGISYAWRMKAGEPYEQEECLCRLGTAAEALLAALQLLGYHAEHV